MIIVIVAIMLFVSSAYALTIVSPKEGEVVYAGSDLTIVAKADPGENWVNVAFGFFPMSYNVLTKKYTYTFALPKSVLGDYDRIIVIGVDKSGKEVELRRRVFIKLPSNIVLKGIVAGGNGGSSFVYLERMPSGSSVTDIENFETEQLSVHGQYSDNVNRDLTASSSGTTYASSDGKVVTVTPEGKVIAQGFGKATITVRNGKYIATVKVAVEPYK